jgi:hypothetical protein
MAAKGRLFFLLFVLCLFAGSRIAAAATNPQDGMLQLGFLMDFCSSWFLCFEGK